MYLLHHNEAELSRALLGTIPDGVSVVDCTKGIPADYVGLSPTAYPSVVVDIPAYMVTAQAVDESGKQVETRCPVPAHQEELRFPESWAAVAEYVAIVTARATANPVT
jgi:hypothetical protein